MWDVFGESIFATTQGTVRILCFPSVILSSLSESLNNICFTIVDASKTAHEIVRLETTTVHRKRPKTTHFHNLRPFQTFCVEQYSEAGHNCIPSPRNSRGKCVVENNEMTDMNVYFVARKNLFPVSFLAELFLTIHSEGFKKRRRQKQRKQRKQTII